MTHELAENKIYGNRLTKINDTFMPQVESQLLSNGINMTEYQKQCVISAIQGINTMLTNSNLSINDVDSTNMTETLMTIAALQVNASAIPREVYFQTRNVNRKQFGQSDNWVKVIEMGIEGDGNDAILSKFGRNVKHVHRHWEVREEDHFSYPGYKGLSVTDPEWGPTGKGKVVRVVYPIEMSDGTIEYHIAEREDVVKNLIAHINQNLMNETFGIAKKKKDASYQQKQEIDNKKQEIMNNLKTMSLDDILDSQEYQSYISPAWKSPQSRESMIVRKMRNNIVKKIPKNFENAYVAMQYQSQDDEVVKLVRKDVTEQTAQEVFDFDEEPSEVKQEAMKHDKETTPDTTIIEPEELAKEPVTSHEKDNEPTQTAFFDDLTTTITSDTDGRGF
ncbi:hypothetical protein GPK35_13245 [Enterococcus faecalis]|uniref:hypothetical protein n=1 Tax=Enterococcus faecalis TaxID=1351 RepID=UPI001C02144F|nr:hypothetical protein [Enterococcus faecalis]MBT9730042.1 hypothetical protein [Enterococcus faecalis]